MLESKSTRASINLIIYQPDVTTLQCFSKNKAKTTTYPFSTILSCTRLGRCQAEESRCTKTCVPHDVIGVLAMWLLLACKLVKKSLMLWIAPWGLQERFAAQRMFYSRWEGERVFCTDYSMSGVSSVRNIPRHCQHDLFALQTLCPTPIALAVQ